MAGTTPSIAQPGLNDWQNGPADGTPAPNSDFAAKADADPVAGLQSVPVTEHIWDEAVAGFAGISESMTVAFARVRWPNVVLEPRLFRRSGEPVSAALVMVQRLPLGLASMAVIKAGPALRDPEATEAQQVYEQTMQALIAEFARERGMMISMIPNAPAAEVSPEYEFLMRRGFRAGSQLLFPNRYMVNLRLSDDDQRRSLAQKWRYHLNKSEKAGLSFERAGPEQFGAFDDLYQAMAERKKFPDYSAYETVPHLLHHPVEGLRPELFFVRHENEIVAGAVIFKTGHRAAYLFGATNDKALPLRAGYFLHWHIISWLRDNTNARWYDLGGTDGFQGLHQFKKGMVGTQGVISQMPPVANYAENRFALAVGLGAYAARDGLQRLRRRLNALRGDRAKPNQARP